MQSALAEPDFVGEDLLARTLAGCRKSAHRLYCEVGDDLLRFCRWMGLSDERCCDVVHEVFELAMAGGLRYEPGRSSARKFLIGVARNKVLEQLRQERAVKPLEEEDAEDAEGSDSSPELLFARSQDVQLVRETMKRLSVAHREVLILCDFRELEYLEAAEVLGLPMGTLQSRLSRARRCLRKLLLEKGLVA